MRARSRLLQSCTVLLAGACAHAVGDIPVYGYRVKQVFPHDAQAYTQGLFYKDGFLYESTGLTGQSSLRKVELATGMVLKKRDLDPDLFGEGIAEVGGAIVGLTWTSHVGFVFDPVSFEIRRRFSYPGEGWGIASDGDHVYLSDGTASLHVLDPRTLAEVGRVRVTAGGAPVARLNELEWVDGEIFANVWGADFIARIDPASGRVVGWIDLRGLVPPAERGGDPDHAVLNGIAWDGEHHRLFVTGKLWPKLFEIELVPRDVGTTGAR